MTASIAALPIQAATDTRTFCEVGPDWIIRDCDLPQFLGTNLLALPGVADTFQNDYELVLHTRQPITVRRFWNSAVWHVTITPSGNDGIRVDSIAVMKFTPNDGQTLNHLCAFAKKVEVALAGGGPAPSNAVAIPASPAAPGRVQLRVVAPPA